MVVAGTNATRQGGPTVTTIAIRPNAALLTSTAPRIASSRLQAPLETSKPEAGGGDAAGRAGALDARKAPGHLADPHVHQVDHKAGDKAGDKAAKAKGLSKFPQSE